MQILTLIGTVALPIIILGIILIGVFRKVDCFSAFTEGAKDGITTTISILPTLIGLMVAIAVFRASGALELLVTLLKPVGDLISLPKEVIPLVLLRPMSGSASLAMLSDIFTEYGPDSMVGRISSILMGSTETLFYTIAVYLAGSGIKKTSYIIPVALISNMISVIIANEVSRIFF